MAAAQGALDSAEAGLKQARELLAQNDPKGALGRLDTAQADCQTAQAASEKATASTGKPQRQPVRPRGSGVPQERLVVRWPRDMWYC